MENLIWGKGKNHKKVFVRLIFDQTRGGMIIKVKEDTPYFVDERLNFEMNGIVPYYSERGELVEVLIISSFRADELFKKSRLELSIDQKFVDWVEFLGREFLKGEVFIPERLPVRKYAFTFGTSNSLPKVCADRLNELNLVDRFLHASKLIIERMDRRKLGYEEVEILRSEFYKFARRSLVINTEAFYDWGIESVYFDGRLFFWIKDEKLYPETWEELKKNVLHMLKVFENCGTGREMDVDILNGEKSFTVECSRTIYHFIANEESFESEIVELKPEDVIKICNELYTMYSSPETQNVFVFYDAIPENPKDREVIKGVMEELCTNSKCEILDMTDFICQYYAKVSELKDLNALENPEEWRDFLRKIFDF